MDALSGVPTASQFAADCQEACTMRDTDQEYIDNMNAAVEAGRELVFQRECQRAARYFGMTQQDLSVRVYNQPPEFRTLVSNLHTHAAEFIAHFTALGYAVTQDSGYVYIRLPA